jgi:sugar phosphate isomerase/epimerase
MKGYDLSIHSGASGIFQPIESFTQANLAVLTAEIDICKMLGVNQFVFHLNDGILSPENKKRLRAVVAHATDRGVQMLYESNSVLVAEDAYDILESFPQLGYVLDLGHLNNGYGCGKLGCEISEFIHQVRNRVIYIHASNNYGKHDEHNSLDDGNLDWRNVLDQLKMSNISKIIIEVKELGMVESSRRALCDYFQTRQGLKPKRTAVDHNTAIQEAVPGL